MGVPLIVKEWMRGYIGLGETDPERGAHRGFADETRFEHAVTISITDIDEFVSNPMHAATLTGSIDCARLGGRCEIVGDATFNMLIDSTEKHVKYIFYRLPFVSSNGDQYTMLGHKTLRDDRGLDQWSDVATLEIRIFKDHTVKGPDRLTPPTGVPEGWTTTPVIAAGVLRIELLDGLRSAMSFTSAGSTRIQKATAVKQFCSFYGSRLWDLFAKVRPREARASQWSATEAFQSSQKLAPVKWLLAGDLLRSAARIARSTFNNELDIRDWMTHDEPIDLRHWPSLSPHAIGEEVSEMWFDYIADTGDDPTVMQELAKRIGRPVDKGIARANGLEPLARDLEVGPFVFVGGDTAYHVADEVTLRARFVEPFKRAIGVREGEQTLEIEQERHLFGIPGNHDYYDNLVGFNRMFRRPYRQRQGVLGIPGYELRQEASYVKLLLPGGWQLWGVDLANGLDYRQWRYFNKVPDKLILCVPTPPVTFDEVRVSKDPDDTENKAYRRLLNKDKLQLDPAVVHMQLEPGQARLHIGGDDHHYARYDDNGRSTCAVSIVSGGGGAFLHPTETSRGEVKRTVSYPDEELSSKQSAKIVYPDVMFRAGLVYVAGSLLGAMMYWTLPRDWSWSEMKGNWAWLAAFAVFGGVLYGAYKFDQRINLARKRVAKRGRPQGAQVEGNAALDLRLAHRLVRPALWILAIAIALAAPYLAKRLEPTVDPLTSEAACLVFTAIVVIALTRFATSRGSTSLFGLMHAVVQLGLPVSLVLRGTWIALTAAAAVWLLFVTFAPWLYVQRHRGRDRAPRPRLAWVLGGLWFVQGPLLVLVLWLIPAFGWAEPLWDDQPWNTLVAAAVGAVMVTVQFGWYLLVAAAFGAHNNELGSAIRTTNYKQWIRFHVTSDQLTGYVIGVDDPRSGSPSTLVDVFRVTPKGK